MKTQSIKAEQQINIKALLGRVSNPFSVPKVKQINDDIPDANLRFLKHMKIQF